MGVQCSLCFEDCRGRHEYLPSPAGQVPVKPCHDCLVHTRVRRVIVNAIVDAQALAESAGHQTEVWHDEPGDPSPALDSFHGSPCGPCSKSVIDPIDSGDSPVRQLRHGAMPEIFTNLPWT
jgi:hypothetical protein